MSPDILESMPTNGIVLEHSPIDVLQQRRSDGVGVVEPLVVDEKPDAEAEKRTRFRISDDWVAAEADKLTDLQTRIRDAQRGCAQSQFDLSHYLIALKEETQHGGFGKVCKKAEFSQRTAQKYMHVGRNPLAYEIFEKLGLKRGDIVADLPTESLRTILDRKNLDELSLNELRDLVREQKTPQSPQQENEPSGETTSSFEKELVRQGRILDAFFSVENRCALARLQFAETTPPKLDELHARHTLLRTALANQPEFLPGLDAAVNLLDAALAALSCDARPEE